MARTELDEEWGPSEPPENDGLLGAAAQLLFQGGDAEGEKAAALLIDVTELKFYRSGYVDGNLETASADLYVDPWVVDRFDEQTRDRIMDALRVVAVQRGLSVYTVRIMPNPASPGWREQVQGALASSTPRNHASLAPLPGKHPRADGLLFRDAGELRVYRVLREEQQRLPKDETFTIKGNVPVCVPDHLWEVDFDISFRGRSGVIEVDGGSHLRKWASDKSRDDILLESGYALVRRIDVEDTTSDQELIEFIRRFLRRLSG